MSNYKASVTVGVADGAAPLEILDGSFQVVAQGFGRLETLLSPGIYKARAQVGAAVSEQLFAVDEGEEPPPIWLNPVAFASPAPLQHTTSSHEYHMAAVAEAFSNPIPAALVQGSGCTMLLSVRDPGDAIAKRAIRRRPEYARSYDGFSLCRADGSLLIDFEVAARRDIEWGFVTAKAELDPGGYILKVARAGLEPVALPVIAVPGWSSQVYLLMAEAPPGGEASYRPQLAEAAVMLMPLGQNFEPGDRSFRLTEVARQALQRGRNILDRNLMNDLLGSKFGNPVLGLFSAHLLLLEAKPPLDLLQTVIGNLSGLLGFDFPDVIALRRRLHQLDPQREPAVHDPISFPPLLRASWEIAAGLAMVDDGIFPQGSVSRKIADRLCDNGIWMAWRPRPVEDAPSINWMSLSDDELAYKAMRDRERIFAAVQSMGAGTKGMQTVPGQVLLQTMKTFAKPVVREKLRQFITRSVSSERPQGERLRELVVRLAKNFDWDELVAKLAELDADGAISRRLSTTQKSLIPALLMYRQKLQAGGDDSAEGWKPFFDALRLPGGVLLENLGDLARLAAGLEVKLAEKTMATYDVVFAEGKRPQKQIIAEMRNLTGLGVKDAKILVNQAPVTMQVALSRVQAEAEELKKELE